MAQKGRPNQTITAGNFTDQDGGTSELHRAIDEVTANDLDYIQSEKPPTDDTCEFQFSNLTDPFSDADHVLRCRLGKNTTGGTTVNITMKLFQGTTEIASYTYADVDVLSLKEETLSSLEADAITDYTDLRVRFTADS
jgi:hypothetical protein